MKITDLFKKGDKVIITHNKYNASDFNRIHDIHIRGVYHNVETWRDEVFEIEGEIELIKFEHSPKTYGAYLLTFNGNMVGYIYNTALKLAK